MVKSEIREVEKIKANYSDRVWGKMDELKELDKKVKSPSKFAYVFGSLSALVFGAGLSMAMKLEELTNLLGDTTVLGIAVGVAGMILMGANYLIYKKRVEKRRAKYKDQIVALSEEILNEKGE